MQSKMIWLHWGVEIPCFLIECGLGILLTVFLFKAAVGLLEEPVLCSYEKIFPQMVLILEMVGLSGEIVYIRSQEQLQDQMSFALLRCIRRNGKYRTLLHFMKLSMAKRE